ncbi:MAG: hypothetical protein AAB873_00840, partial [Patescibacteria group bacterium]
MINKRSFARPPQRAGGAKSSFRFSGGSKFKKTGSRFPAKKKRFGGERIDFSRFIKKAEYKEEKPYMAKHT